MVAYSSGNFAQGLAAAGQRLGIPVTIVMPVDAPLAKRDATAGYGATRGRHRARRPGRARKSRMERARQIAAEDNLVLLASFRRPGDRRRAGRGRAGGRGAARGDTARSADMVFCPVGGGGLIGGVALAFHYLSPKTEIVGVEPEDFDGMGVSLASGEIETRPLVADDRSATG